MPDWLQRLLGEQAKEDYLGRLLGEVQEGRFIGNDPSERIPGYDPSERIPGNDPSERLPVSMSEESYRGLSPNEHSINGTDPSAYLPGRFPSGAFIEVPEPPVRNPVADSEYFGSIAPGGAGGGSGINPDELLAAGRKRRLGF